MTSIEGSRLRAAEQRHAGLAVQLAEHEAELRALRVRAELTDELHAQATARLHAEITDLAAALAQAAAERDALRAEVDRAAAAERAHREEAQAAHRETDHERARAAEVQAQLAAVLDQAAADRGQLLARIARLEQQLASEAGARRQLAAYEGTEPEELHRELAAMERALEAARQALAESRPVAPHIEERAELTDDARDALERAVQTSRRESSARIRELEQLVSTLSFALAATRDDIDRAARSRAWRLGHGVTRTASRVTRRARLTDGALASAVRRIEEVQRATRTVPAGREPVPAGEVIRDDSPPVALPREAVLAQRRRLAADIRLRLGAPPAPDPWPGVSLIVPTYNGRAHLERLVAGLRDATDYPALELVVVDNGSADGTGEWLQAIDDLPLTLVRNAENVSYSEANARGAEAARHDLLLLLNNDVEPFEAGWLRELVAAHVLGGAMITGATLLHTETTEAAADGQLVQHRRVALRRTASGVLPYNAGDGAQLFHGAFGVELPALAVSGACLMIARRDFDLLGGLSTRYRYGLEDVDLALRAADAGGRIAGTGRAVLYHTESATRLAEGTDTVRAARVTNRRALREAWGPRLRRAYGLGRLSRDATITDGRGPHIAITVTSLDPTDGWGDWYTAHELGDALAARGWRVDYVPVAKDGTAPLPAGVDYVLTLLDRFDLGAVPVDVGVIAWLRNWVDRWLERTWLDRVDLLLASSTTTAELVEQRTGHRPEVFPLATNAARFARARAAEPAVDCVFTGNHWGKDRDIQAGLAPGRGQTLAIHGRGWDKVRKLAKHDAGPADYEQLPGVYASAKLVLDDTQAPTLAYDAVNARVFDALAAGTLVLTNCAGGVRELFDDDFPVWTDHEDLRAQRDALLADDARRAELVARYRETVLRHHTYEHRADRLGTLLREHEARPSFCIKIGAPDWAQAERWGDLHFARAIERELRRRGHRVLVQVLEEWENDEGLDHDVVLHLKGLSRHYTKPGQFNVLWCISHPDELTGEECDAYDLVAIASPAFAEQMRPRTETPVIVLEQATDPRVFFPDPDEGRHHDVVYVANSRNVLRPVLRDLLPTDFDLAVYGANWEGLIDMRHVRAEHVPNEELRRIYSSAKVVLADHWDDMREHGFIANRIYDALACGARIVSDDVAGLAGRFGDAVRTYRTPEELRAAIDAALAAPPRADPVAVPDFSGVVDTLLAAIDR